MTIENLTVVIPYYNGDKTIVRLIDTLPKDLPVIVVDDQSDYLQPPYLNRPNTLRVVRLESKGYFAGAVNRGIEECETDVLVLNQDTWFDSDDSFQCLESLRREYAFVGERISGTHPSFGELGYVHGVFMFIRRDAIQKVGLLNSKDYPLWGNTAEYQWRLARSGFNVLPLKTIPGFHHERKEGERYGSSIRQLLRENSHRKEIFIRTPPRISVIIPCYNYGRYLSDCVNSLIGGKTSLGEMSGQTIQDFEIIIVNDASTDDSQKYIDDITDISKGIRSYQLKENVGTAKVLNFAIEKAIGKYITFLSADDMREADSLEKLLRVCESNPHSFVYDDVWLFNKNKRIKQWQMQEYDFEKLVLKNQIHAGILYPKIAWEEAGGYPAIMNDGREDWAFNVALGIKGWCGIHVNNYGYLYRREGQNRTERNTTPEHRENFLEKMKNIFPNIYRGDRPVACCGKGGSPRTSNSKRTANSNNINMQGEIVAMSKIFGKEGMEKIQYTGNQLQFTVAGDFTHVTYVFGKDRSRGWVDKRDIGSRQSKTGFLSKKDKQGNWLYRLADTENSNKKAQEISVVVEDSIKTVEVEKQLDNSKTVEGKKSIETISSLSENKLESPNPTDLNVEEIKRLNLSKSQWEEVYKIELANRSRKGALNFIEETLANWED